MKSICMESACASKTYVSRKKFHNATISTGLRKMKSYNFRFGNTVFIVFKLI